VRDLARQVRNAHNYFLLPLTRFEVSLQHIQIVKVIWYNYLTVLVLLFVDSETLRLLPLKSLTQLFLQLLAKHKSSVSSVRINWKLD
jgi:hypothetical protein